MSDLKDISMENSRHSKGMTLFFSKYQGAGNDFILIDDRQAKVRPQLDAIAIQYLCDRHFGIGADGVILLCAHEGYDFEMVYFNSDGGLSTFCGNGSRCIAHFAGRLGIGNSRNYTFLALDGPHQAELTSKDQVTIRMKSPILVKHPGAYWEVDTGSPHYVLETNTLERIPVQEEGKVIRQNWSPEGINVNWMQWKEGGLHVRTYERGVEGETLACGTGIVACALAYVDAYGGDIQSGIPVHAVGGVCLVRARSQGDHLYDEIYLSGPAFHVFEGSIQVW